MLTWAAAASAQAPSPYPPQPAVVAPPLAPAPAPQPIYVQVYGATPPPPQPVVVAPPMAPQPLPVAMFPEIPEKALKNWEDGDPIPPGYTPVQRTRRGLVIGGAVTFGTLYLISVLSAAILQDTADERGTSSDAGGLYVPAIGPFIAAAAVDDSAVGSTFLALDGLAQSAGIAMLIAGIAAPKTILIRDMAAQVSVTPSLSAGFQGVGVTVAF